MSVPTRVGHRRNFELYVCLIMFSKKREKKQQEEEVREKRKRGKLRRKSRFCIKRISDSL